MKLRRILSIIGIILIAYILSTMDLSKIANIVSSISLCYLLLCFFACLPVVLLSNYQWQVLLQRHKIYVDFATSLKNIFIGYFYGFISPGGIGGYTRIVYLHDDTNVPFIKCIANIVLFNTIDFISLLCIGFCGGIYLTITFPQLYAFLVFIIILSCVVSILVYLFFIKKHTIQHIFDFLMRSSFLNPYREKLNGSIEQFYKDIPQVRDITFPLILSVVGWLVRFFIFFFIAQLFSIQISILFFIAIIAVADIVATFPLSIYGLGTREVTLIGLFSLFKIPTENVISFSLFVFVVSWLIPSLVGLVITLFEGKNKSANVPFKNT